MGYGYAETFLIVFLTHPGVIKFSQELPQKSDYVPTFTSALLQVIQSAILSLPGRGSVGLAWTFYTIYLVFLGVYTYYNLTLRLSSGT